MARVSIQYSMHNALDAHDEKKMKKVLDEFPGVKSISVNIESGLLCIDFDDTGVQRQQLEKKLEDLDYTFTMLDQITF